MRSLPAPAPDPQHARIGVLPLRALQDRSGLPAVSPLAGEELPRF